MYCDPQTHTLLSKPKIDNLFDVQLVLLTILYAENLICLFDGNSIRKTKLLWNAHAINRSEKIIPFSNILFQCSSLNVRVLLMSCHIKENWKIYFKSMIFLWFFCAVERFWWIGRFYPYLFFLVCLLRSAYSQSKW